MHELATRSLFVEMENSPSTMSHNPNNERIEVACERNDWLSSFQLFECYCMIRCHNIGKLDWSWMSIEDGLEFPVFTNILFVNVCLLSMRNTLCLVVFTHFASRVLGFISGIMVAWWARMPSDVVHRTTQRRRSNRALEILQQLMQCCYTHVFFLIT